MLNFDIFYFFIIIINYYFLLISTFANLISNFYLLYLLKILKNKKYLKGVYRSIPGQQNGQSNTLFRTVLMCNNIKIIGTEVGAVRLTADDVKNIRFF
jgi:hypothetical protein